MPAVAPPPISKENAAKGRARLKVVCEAGHLALEALGHRALDRSAYFPIVNPPPATPSPTAPSKTDQKLDSGASSHSPHVSHDAQQSSVPGVQALALAQVRQTALELRRSLSGRLAPKERVLVAGMLLEYLRHERVILGLDPPPPGRRPPPTPKPEPVPKVERRALGATPSPD